MADKVDSQEICFVPGNDYKAFLRAHLGEDKFHRGGIYDRSGEFLGEHGGLELFTIGQRKGLPGGSAQRRYVVDLDPATNRVIVGDADDLVVDEFEIDRVNWHSHVEVTHSGHVSASPLNEGERIACHAVAERRREVRISSMQEGRSSKPSPYPLPFEGRGDRTPALGGDNPGSSFEATVKIRYSHPGTKAMITPLENDRARISLHDPQRAVTPGQAAVVYAGDIVVGGGWICRRESAVLA